MFTGLIETTGTVLTLKPIEGGATRIVVAAPALAGRWKIGDSIAVNGVCLTATDVQDADEPHPGRFAADLADETIRRTTLTRLSPGALVNLELPTPSGAPMGGHVVQGHVDGTGRILSIEPLHPDLDRTDWRLRLEAPRALAASIVQQGSITIDGISLTVARLDPPDTQGNVSLEIAVIPHTYQATNLRSLLSGSEVNLETDVLARYAARRMEFSEPKPAPLATPDVTAATIPTELPPPPTTTWETLAPTLSRTAPLKPSEPNSGITAEYLIANGF